jgi:hypothetical protein
MLLSKTVKLKWGHGTPRKYYENLGYEYTKPGDEFEVQVRDLPFQSSALVSLRCDECGKEYQRRYYNCSSSGVNRCADCNRAFYRDYKPKYLKRNYQQNQRYMHEV